jgi:hypothetical protein
MDESKQIIKEQLKRIPENLRKCVSGSSWSDSVSRIAKQFNVPQDKTIDLENEVFFVLLCLEPPKDFVENIKKEIGLDENTARKIADSINGSVFSPVMRDIKSVWGKIPNEIPQTPEPQIKSYDSFEQTILRQAQAMKPAQVAAPNNIPTGISSKANSDYSASNDPYREPIE